MSTLSFGEKRCGTRKAEAPAQAAAGPVSAAMAERPARPHQGDTRTVSTSIETPKPNGMNLHVAQHSPNGTAPITRSGPEVTLRGVGGTQQHQLAPPWGCDTDHGGHAPTSESRRHAPLAARKAP